MLKTLKIGLTKNLSVTRTTPTFLILCKPKDVHVMAKRLKLEVWNETNMKLSTTFGDKSKDMETSNPIKYLPPPIKSQSDKKEYSVLQLPNGLTACLISDMSELVNLEETSRPRPTRSRPSTDTKSRSSSVGSESSSTLGSAFSESEGDTGSSVSDDVTEEGTVTLNKKQEKLAACALCIGVGSFSDPEEIPGLAHFLEHMVFMGSEKYPTENEFDAFIKKGGGNDNASTECEYTTFYFDCHEVHLHNGMDIFSQLFISPLLKRETMTKEREAIESEFEMTLPSDSARRCQLLCKLADFSNPVHKFMWGNLITLRDNVSDDALYKSVHEFRKRHYSANRMTLAIQARLPLQTLEEWVIECFGKVPNNGLSRDEFKLSQHLFKPEVFRKLFTIEPVKDINRIDLTWVMPPTLHLYKPKPLTYIAWVIGHEGKGSLFSYLKNKLWVLNMTASGVGDGTDENSLYTLFTIHLKLTQQGLLNIEHILSAVFEYITLFQNLGPQERLFKELHLIYKMNFMFLEEVPPSENVETLAQNMQLYPSIDYIAGSELYTNYDPDLIKDCLDKLTPESVNIMISSKSAALKVNLDDTEPWYGTKYHSDEIPQDWIERWKDIKPSNVFHLPEPNDFLTSNFSILPPPNQQEEYPQKIVSDETVELWYRQDTHFKLPFVVICLHLVSPLSYQSPQDAAMLDLFISVLYQILREETYSARVAQLDYSFHAGEKGIVIKLDGFNEKLSILLQVVIDKMIALKELVTFELYSAIKHDVKREYNNSNIKTAFLARDIRMSILCHTYWTAIDKRNALSDVTFERFKDFSAKYFEHLYIQGLIQGNISKEEALDVAEKTRKQIDCKPLLPNTLPQNRVYQLPLGEKCCKVRSFNKNDANCRVTNYYQSGPGTLHDSSLLELLITMMEEPVFDTLRTQQQLGYDVSCSIQDTYGIIGWSVTVNCQADKCSVEHVEMQITKFLAEFVNTIKNMSKEDFQEMKVSLIKLKKCADIHLKEEVKRNWYEIMSCEYMFDRIHKEITCIEELKREDLSKWFESHLGLNSKPNLRKLSTQVIGVCRKSSVDKSIDCTEQIEINIGVNNEINVHKETLPDDGMQESGHLLLNFLSEENQEGKCILNTEQFKNSLLIYPVHKIL